MNRGIVIDTKDVSGTSVTVDGQNTVIDHVYKVEVEILKEKLSCIYYRKIDTATKIREKSRLGKSLAGLVHEKVEEYIREKKLYFIPNAFEALSLEKEERRAHSLRVAELAASRAVAFQISEKKLRRLCSTIARRICLLILPIYRALFPR